MHIKEDDPRIAVVEKFMLFACGWGAAICLAFSFYRWRQRKYWTIRQGYLDALDARAKERPLTREEQAVRRAIAAEQQQKIRWKPKDEGKVMSKTL